MSPTARYIAPSWQRPGHAIWKCNAPACELEVLTPGGEAVPHACPHYLLEIRTSWMAYGPTLLQQTWDDLDALYDEYTQLRQPSNDDETVQQQEILRRMEGRMRGIASVLARFMVPHLKTEDDVIREVMRRSAARKNDEPYETPGLGSRRFEPPPGDNKLATRPVHQVKITLSEEDQALVRSTPVESANDDLMARMFKCTPAEIKAIRNSDC